MTDIVDRAKAALEGVSEEPWEAQDWDSHANGDRGCGILAGTGMHQRGIAYTGLYRWNSEAEATANAAFIVQARSLVPELIAEIERLHTWDGLMSLLDEYYPEDIFPTMEDREDRDPGPRIISLIRQLSDAHVHIEHWKALWRQNTESAGQAMLERDAALRDAESLRIGLSNSGVLLEEAAKQYDRDVCRCEEKS